MAKIRGNNRGDYGILFESSGGEVSINVYRNGTVIHSVPQSQWAPNTPTAIDWSKNQILVIDFQFLGVGRIRFYLDIYGEVDWRESV